MPVIDKSHYSAVLNSINETPNPVHHRIEFDIVAGGQVYKAISLVEINDERNFIANYCGSTTVVLSMTQEMFNKVVLPNKDDIRLIRRKLDIGEISNEVLPSSKLKVKTLAATLLMTTDPALQGAAPVDDGMVLSQYVFSVLELAVDQLRLTQAGGTFRYTTTLDIARAMYTSTSKGLKLPKEEMVLGVTCEPSDVTEPPKCTVVPPEVKLVDLVDYLQSKCGGIYNQGAGLYFQDRSWFIYPLYNTTRYKKAKYAADIVVLPPNQALGSDRTYVIKDSRLFIAATAGVRQSNPQEIEYLNSGNGVRFVNASSFNESPVKVAGNKATTKLNENTAHISVKDRKAGLQSAPFSSSRITDNIANELSKVAARSGQILHIPWQNCDPDLIIPGMPCRILFSDGSKDRELYGTILGIQSHTRLSSPGITGVRYTTSSVLLVFANPLE
jgi:hypothetical protein